LVITVKEIILSDRFAMKTELIEKASEIITDPPLLINLVSKRVQQLNSGRSPLITMVERMGAADIALTEIIEGKIVLEHGDTEE
jgi:DNA-directed RNA polymerase subunit omega|tara:strand:- start:381 stop:632 length:252 start_codon:yes stop_codon:yes gene_type:complete